MSTLIAIRLVQSIVLMVRFAQAMVLVRSLRALTSAAKASFVEAVCVMKGILEMTVRMGVQPLREICFLVQGMVYAHLWVEVQLANVNLDGLDLPVLTEPVFHLVLFS
jgi:hypothetical protein